MKKGETKNIYFLGCRCVLYMKHVTVDDLRWERRGEFAGLAIVAFGSLLRKREKSHPSPLFAVNFLQEWTLSLSLSLRSWRNYYYYFFVCLSPKHTKPLTTPHYITP